MTPLVTQIDIHLGNEMADIIAQVIRLADVYHIDLEKAYIEAREIRLLSFWLSRNMAAHIFAV